jgi:hypothetical protein
VRDYNPTDPLGVGTEEPHPLPLPTISDEVPVVGALLEARGNTFYERGQDNHYHEI